MNKTTGVKPPQGSEPNPWQNSPKTTVHKKSMRCPHTFGLIAYFLQAGAECTSTCWQLLTWMWGVAKGLISQPLSTQRKLEAVITVMEIPAASTVSCAKVICSVLYRKQTNKPSLHCLQIWQIQFSVDLTVSRTKRHVTDLSLLKHAVHFLTLLTSLLFCTLHAYCLLKAHALISVF